jgi:hypothetical protein
MPVPCGVPLPVALACRMMLWVHAFANVVFPTVSKNARKLSPAQLPFLSWFDGQTVQRSSSNSFYHHSL